MGSVAVTVRVRISKLFREGEGGRGRRQLSSVMLSVTWYSGVVIVGVKQLWVRCCAALHGILAVHWGR